MLSQLEHRILSMMMNDIEPLHIIYKCISTDIKEVKIETVLKSLVKLVEMGLVEVKYHNADWETTGIITVQKLKQHCFGRSEGELRDYPKDTGEYFFRPTDEGRREENKDIYDIYYPK